VILDGLDEMSEKMRPVALRALSQQAAFRLIILSRRAEMAVAAAGAPLASAAAVELLPVEPEDAADFLARLKVYPAPPGWAELIERLLRDKGSPVSIHVPPRLLEFWVTLGLGCRGHGWAARGVSRRRAGLVSGMISWRDRVAAAGGSA
jgi:hypothetical protein